MTRFVGLLLLSGVVMALCGGVVAVVAMLRRNRLRRTQDRLRQQQALSEERARSEALTQHASDIITLLNREGRIIFVSASASRILGYPPGFLQGKDPTEFVHPDELARARKSIEQVRQHTDPGVPVEVRVRHAQGHWVLIEVMATNLLDQPGVNSILVTIRDITERKQAENEIRRLNETLERRVIERTAQLEAANKELEAFAYSVSHDLRAPLRAIDGYTSVLVEDFSDVLGAKGQGMCGVIRGAARRMDQLIGALLEFSRLGRTELRSAPVDMEALARAVVDEVASPEERGRVQFRLGSLPAADGDARLLRQVWMNLLANAVKFSAKSEQPFVEVSGRQDAGECVYAVRDNGAGFDMQYSSRLFGVFQRLHSEREFKGTGIGLAIVQRVVHRHGGRVWAEGKPNEGATFSFSLPRKG